MKGFLKKYYKHLIKNKNLEKLKSIKGYEECLQHDSYIKIKKNKDKKFQKFEFLGDRVLGLTISEYLVSNYMNDSVDDISRRFIFLVNKKTLSDLFKKNQFDSLLSHDLDDTINKNSVYSDALESIIGFVYLNKGLNFSKKFIYEIWSDLLDTLPEKDPKTYLQETAQRLFKQMPLYKTVSQSGNPHKPLFKVSVTIKDLETFGEGYSKQNAEIKAAKNLIKIIKDYD
ncbi:MAG: ribonuclease III family protein [Alphaproteobacteria bacterium]|jgi:ribonuclease-3|tara:strand:- start:2471 stop:3154 length:684 start_codon:yes stop_codon:yes gene_type:complete